MDSILQAFQVSQLELGISSVVILVLVVLLLRFKYIEYRKRQKQKKRFKRGSELETKAKYFLKRQGYKILQEQAVYYHMFKANGKEKKAKLIIDYVVRKKGKTFLVEVKSGQSAISIQNKFTRRQILEYDFVIENNGILLLDMEHEILELIEFKSKTEKPFKPSVKFLIFWMSIGIFTPYWTIKILIFSIAIVFWFFPQVLMHLITRIYKVFP